MRTAIFFTVLFVFTGFVLHGAGWAASKNVTLRLGDAHVMGSKNAPVTLVEFTDYQCPACAHFHKNIFPKFVREFVQTGKVRFISRDFPLGFHKNAFQAARAARCAGEQKKYWEMRDLLSSHPRKLSTPSLLNYAKKLRLHVGRFRVCLKSQRYEREVKQDMADGRRVGVTGTPGFIFGHSPRPGSRFFRGKLFMGVPSYESYADWVDYLIATRDK